MTPCTDKKHQAMKDDGYAKCWDCGESFYAERKPPVVAPTELLAVLIDLCEAIDAYQSERGPALIVETQAEADDTMDGCPEEYDVSEVEMTRDQFSRLGEFNGF